MIALVTGSRDWVEKELLADVLFELQPDEIIAGACEGADTMAVELAREWAIPFREFPAIWYPCGPNGGYDPGAGEKRNIRMANQLEVGRDVIVACLLPQCRGTRNMIRIGLVRGHRVIEIRLAA